MIENALFSNLSSMKNAPHMTNWAIVIVSGIPSPESLFNILSWYKSRQLEHFSVLSLASHREVSLHGTFLSPRVNVYGGHTLFSNACLNHITYGNGVLNCEDDFIPRRRRFPLVE